ncbi:MAG: hypothetical protein L3J96_01140 [Thermoplasmata archaeon]|nr:hypothetical protein [Thermoplasmata archaeon]
MAVEVLAPQSGSHHTGISFPRFPASVVREAVERGLKPGQLLDLSNAWCAGHWYPPTSLAEVVEEVLL